MDNDAPLISVIIPVYNVEEFLPRCIDSVLRQTYTNLEIIIVDDGSTDGSARMVDDYAHNNEQVKVAHIAHAGQARARNVALDMVTGSFVAFVDSDDYIVPWFIEVLWEYLCMAQADIAECAWIEEDENKFDRQAIDDTLPSEMPDPIIFEHDAAINDSFYQRRLTSSLCRRLFRVALFNNYRFKEGRIYEDLDAEYPLLSQCTRVVYVPITLYAYLHRPQSTLGVMSLDRTAVLDVTDELEQRVGREAPRFLPAVRSRKLSANFNILLLCDRSDERYATVADRCWNNICALRLHCLVDPHIRFKNRMGIIASFLGRRLFLTLFSRHQ